MKPTPEEIAEIEAAERKRLDFGDDNDCNSDATYLMSGDSTVFMIRHPDIMRYRRDAGAWVLVERYYANSELP